MMPLPVGQEPPPRYVWLPPEAADQLRRSCTVLGAGLLAAGPVLGAPTVLIAYRLPTSRHVFTTFTALMGGLAGVFLFLCGCVLVGARSYVSTQHVNVAGTQVLRRLLVVFAAATVLVAGLAALLVLAMVDGSAAATVSPGVVAYLQLPLSCAVLAVAAAVLTWRPLDP